MGSLEYLDFRLTISPAQGENLYEIKASSDVAGGASCTFASPFSATELENFVLRVGLTRRGTRRIGSPEWETAREFGDRLYKALFTGQVRDCFLASRSQARGKGQALRIKLALTKGEILNYPWEFLYDADRDRFLALYEDTPIVRYLDMPVIRQSLTVDPPLRLLVMASSPSDFDTLDLERERQNLEEAVHGLRARGMISLDWLEEANLEALRKRLMQREYHIFHFIGHGRFDQKVQDGVLILSDESGRSEAVSAERLSVLLGNHRTLRLVVLNACEGARTSPEDPFAGAATTLVRSGGLPAVVAMQFEITNEAAIAFAGGFYSALVVGRPVDAAVTQARLAIFAQDNDVEWGTPVLYMRSPDGRLFEVRGEDTSISKILNVISEPLGTQKYDEAIRLAEEALGTHPSEPRLLDALVDAYYQKGLSLYVLRRYVDAVQAFDQVLGLRPGYKSTEEWRKNALEQIKGKSPAVTGPEAEREPEPEPPAEGLRFSSGERPRYLGHWAELAEENWGEAIDHLYGGGLEEWLFGLGQKELAQQAGRIRETVSDRSVGLERFLRASGSKPQSKRDAETNIDHIIRELSFSELRKHKRQKTFQLQITNKGRGYLHGRVEGRVSWLRIPQPRFGCLPGETATVEIVFVPASFSPWRPSLRIPLEFILE